MNKEVLIALITKDVKELDKLTQGFSVMNSFPAPYMDLAIDKAKNLVENITLLSDTGNETVIAEKETLTVHSDEPDTLPTNVVVEEQNTEEPQQGTDVHEIATETTEAVEIETRTVEEEKEAVYEEEIVPEQEPESQSQEEEECTVQESAPIEEEAENDYAEEEVVCEEGTTTLGDSIKSGESILNTLSKNQDPSIASTVAMKKIDDLKSALTIADRFRFQRELFGGDGERMMQAINDFNQMKSMDEALTFINKKFAWKKDSPCVESFLQLIQRRYM